jgi:translation initiation factor IF-3
VVVSVVFRGRENAHVDEGFKVVRTFIEELDEIAKVESAPSLQGRRIVAILAPR